MKLKLFIFSILLFFFVFRAQGQDYPHVTDIKIEARNNLIRITWTDSPVARGPVYIYRSARPFLTEIPANLRPITVNYGVQYYIDDADDLEIIYYFIAASDAAGRLYNLIIPEINSASAGFSFVSEQEPDSSPSPLSVITHEPVFIEGLSGLRAVLSDDKVTITFNNTNPGRNTLLYRSINPIRRPQDLINAGLIQPVTNIGREYQFIDYPIPGYTWYYAVIYEDEVSGGSITINPGINATASAVIISAEDAAGRSMRPIPLPELTLSERNGGFLTNPANKMPLGADSIDVINSASLPPAPRMEIKKPRAFIIDLEAPAGGEESALYQIINEYFKNFDWENARVRLQHFLTLPKSKEVEARARFYLGQTFYFTGRYREALWEFLSFRARHQTEANIWIEAVLRAMAE